MHFQYFLYIRVGMVKKFAVLIFVLGNSFILFSQVSFSWYPNDTLIQVIAKNTYTEMKIEQVKKNREDTLSLSIEVVESTIPSDWDGLVCVYGLCLGSILEKGKMFDMNPNSTSEENSYVRLTVNPMDSEKESIYRVRVFNKKNPKDGDTATWIINAKNANIHESQTARDFVVFPNPASNFIEIPVNHKFTSFVIFDLTGKKVFENHNLSEPSVRVDLASWKPGVYFVQFLLDAHVLASQKLIVHE